EPDVAGRTAAGHADFECRFPTENTEDRWLAGHACDERDRDTRSIAGTGGRRAQGLSFLRLTGVSPATSWPPGPRPGALVAPGCSSLRALRASTRFWCTTEAA